MGGGDLYILSIIAELYGTEFPDFSAHYFNQMIQTVYKNNLLRICNAVMFNLRWNIYSEKKDPKKSKISSEVYNEYI